jgi:hypothetical protein
MTSRLGVIFMKKVFQLMILIFLLFSGTTALYAQVSKDDNVYLNELSDFYLVDQALSNQHGGSLVPLGAIRGVNDVYYVDFEYEIVMKKGMDLQVLVEDIFFTNENVTEEQLLQTFNFDISYTVVEELQESEHFLSETELAERIIVTVSVSMNEPTTYELMSELFGGQLGFEVYFFAADL